MMKALVVYESMYGNTAAVGEAIATSLRTGGLDVDAGPISRITPADAAGSSSSSWAARRTRMG